MFEKGEGNTSLLQGFTLTGGSGTKPSCCNNGGGVFCVNGSSPTVANCTIPGNATYDGGGVFCEESSSPRLVNCLISGNAALQNGGGVYCGENSSPALTDCTITRNSAGYGGGGAPHLQELQYHRERGAGRLVGLEFTPTRTHSPR